MSEPFLGEIKLVGFNFPPRGWAQCDGQLLPINQNQSLYSLLGTTYGGDGRTTFALPDLRGRVPIHVGNGHNEGQKSGEERHALNLSEMPQHKHLRATSNSADSPNPDGRSLAHSDVAAYDSSENLETMKPPATAGGGQPHENMQPYLVVNFVIALQGLFPSRN